MNFNYISPWQKDCNPWGVPSPHATTQRNGNGGQMKLIDISTPKHPNTFTIVDDEDFEYLNQWKWGVSCGYAIRRIWGSTKSFRMQREITKVSKGFLVDHINGNKLDNRKENLRICTTAENTRNRHKIKVRLLPKGVYWRPKEKKYRAIIRFNYKHIHLGVFRTIPEASTAYNEAALKYHGEFARINKPIEVNQ
jgi:hypothetical protein